MKQELLKEFRKIIIQSVKETEKEHGSPSVYIDMVGEIADELLDDLETKTNQ